MCDKNWTGSPLAKPLEDPNKVQVGLHFGSYFQKELSFLSLVKDEIQYCNFYAH